MKNFFSSRLHLIRSVARGCGLLLLLLWLPLKANADNGHRLWMKYDRIEDRIYLQQAKTALQALAMPGDSAMVQAARRELQNGLRGLLATNPPQKNSKVMASGQLLIGTPAVVPAFQKRFREDLSGLGDEGFLIQTVKVKNGNGIVITANSDRGILYGTFHFLRLLQTRADLELIDVRSRPKLQWRMLNHWDNVNGSIERGYAGSSLWKWEELPAKIDPRYTDYARANASIGINGVVLNSVNASPIFLSAPFIAKTAALARVFRPYGIRVFLSANFAAPKALGKLDTADPLDPRVQQWWQNKAAEIYRVIPDFGGFLVKANSEGQPGPQDYQRSHAQGANMMARALAPHRGVLIWRAFVYKSQKDDRVKDAYDEFAPLDGRFAPNVFLQIKNGPIDFQPREPFSPLFGAMPHTPQMMEFQLTQEYLGFSTALVYLPALFKEVLGSDTYAHGQGSTVARVIDGSLHGQKMTGMAGVANIGDDANWTGHLFAQANWYALGRLAWDHELSAATIAEEWIAMTLTHDTFAAQTLQKLMLASHQILVDYQTPLGLNVLASPGHHYGPAPWVRADYHRVDSKGLGFDRTASGSNSVAQYFPPVRAEFAAIDNCPERFLLWFHHVPWQHRMKSGRNLWEELCARYYTGVAGVRQMQHSWRALKTEIDPEIFAAVDQRLTAQEDEAVWWRDANLWYFQKYSALPIPQQYEKPRYHEADFKRKEQDDKSRKVHSAPRPPSPQ